MPAFDISISIWVSRSAIHDTSFSMAHLSDTSQEYLGKNRQLIRPLVPNVHYNLPVSCAACLPSIFVQRLHFALKATESYDVDLGAV